MQVHILITALPVLVHTLDVSFSQLHILSAPTSEDAPGAGPAAKRPRVEYVLQQHAPGEQLLVSELMGWGHSSQEPLSTLGTGAVSKG